MSSLSFQLNNVYGYVFPGWCERESVTTANTRKYVFFCKERIRNGRNPGCGIKGCIPASVIQGNPRLCEQMSLWEALSVVGRTGPYLQLGPPLVPFLALFGQGSPTEIIHYRRKVGTLILTSLLEDLGRPFPPLRRQK